MTFDPQHASHMMSGRANSISFCTRGTLQQQKNIRIIKTNLINKYDDIDIHVL